MKRVALCSVLLAALAPGATAQTEKTPADLTAKLVARVERALKVEEERQLQQEVHLEEQAQLPEELQVVEKARARKGVQKERKAEAEAIRKLEEPVILEVPPATTPEPAAATTEPSTTPEPTAATTEPATTPEPATTSKPVAATTEPATTPELATTSKPATTPKPATTLELATTPKPATTPEPATTPKPAAATPEPATTTPEPTTTPKPTAKPTRAKPRTTAAKRATTPEPTTTKPATVKCWEDSAYWEPLDMPYLPDPAQPGLVVEYPATKALGPAACQKQCAEVKGCAHFSFWRFNGTSGEGYCHFQDAYAVKRQGRWGFTSGPAECAPDGSINPDSAAYLTHALPAGVSCAETDVTYSPVQAIETLKGSQTKVITSCKLFCERSQDCAYFTVQFPMGYCMLHPVGAVRLPGVIGALSAPVMCANDIKYRQRKFDARRLPGLGGPAPSALGACALLGALAAAAGMVLARVRRARLAPAGSAFEPLASEEASEA